jgi:hypothetical protein
MTKHQQASEDGLALFDENTKRCTMNCGSSTSYPQSRKEMKFRCDDCETISPESEPELDSSNFRVSVQTMKESHRETYYVCIDRPCRPIEANPWDDGRMMPYMTEVKERAEHYAQEWADFFDVKVSI